MTDAELPAREPVLRRVAGRGCRRLSVDVPFSRLDVLGGPDLREIVAGPPRKIRPRGWPGGLHRVPPRIVRVRACPRLVTLDLTGAGPVHVDLSTREEHATVRILGALAGLTVRTPSRVVEVSGRAGGRFDTTGAVVGREVDSVPEAPVAVRIGRMSPGAGGHPPATPPVRNVVVVVDDPDLARLEVPYPDLHVLQVEGCPSLAHVETTASVGLLVLADCPALLRVEADGQLLRLRGSGASGRALRLGGPWDHVSLERCPASRAGMAAENLHVLDCPHLSQLRNALGHNRTLEGASAFRRAPRTAFLEASPGFAGAWALAVLDEPPSPGFATLRRAAAVVEHPESRSGLTPSLLLAQARKRPPEERAAVWLLRDALMANLHGRPVPRPHLAARGRPWHWPYTVRPHGAVEWMADLDLLECCWESLRHAPQLSYRRSAILRGLGELVDARAMHMLARAWSERVREGRPDGLLREALRGALQRWTRMLPERLVHVSVRRRFAPEPPQFPGIVDQLLAAEASPAREGLLRLLVAGLAAGRHGDEGLVGLGHVAALSPRPGAPDRLRATLREEARRTLAAIHTSRERWTPEQRALALRLLLSACAA